MARGLSRRGFLRGTLLAGAATAVRSAAATDADAPVVVEPPVEPSAVHEGLVPVDAIVNGQPVTSSVHPDDRALDLVRDQLGLTGSKESCGQGACGACTALVDGVPVCLCLLPATSVHGRTVTTVEGIVPMHPVQRAMAAEDGLQCGFCTPGFVVEATAFHDRWRQSNPSTGPTTDQVAAALSGHLCRCGAYARIVEAVRAACTGMYDDADVVPARVDAYAKITGAAQYTTDVRVDGMLEAYVLCSSHAHAQVRTIDTHAAVGMPGVKAVMTLVASGSIIRFHGQPIAAVAAETLRAARTAAAAIDVDYHLLAPVLGFKGAMARDAPLVYARERGTAPNANEMPMVPSPWKGNVRGPLRLSVLMKPRKSARHIDTARAGFGNVVEEQYETHTQLHTCMEPHAAVARWDAADQLTVWLSTQAVSDMAADIAKRWGLKREAVRVIAEHVGGGFGSKAVLHVTASIAIDLAARAHRPVRVTLERHQELALGGLRPANRTDLSVAVAPTGSVEAVRARSYSDAGVAVGNATTAFMRMMYPSAYKSLWDFDVVTTAAPGCPFRGPGGPPAFWALEQTIDQLAVERRQDAIALRRKIDPNPQRQRLYNWATSLTTWSERGPTPDRGRFRRGVGVASAGWFYLLTTFSEVQLTAHPDGRWVVSTAAQDIGNGTRTVLATAVAEALGIPRRDVEVRIGDSDLVYGPMAAGSRTTASLYPTAIDAAEQVAAALLEVATEQLHLEDARAVPGGISHVSGFMSWAEAMAVAPKVSAVGRRRRDQGGYAFGAAGTRVGKGIAGAVQLTEVEVDTRLARVRVIGSHTGIGVGRIVCPPLARSQVEGGVLQGIGYALYEERRLCPVTGRLLTTGLEDYRLLGISDVPSMTVYFDEEGFDHVRGGAVGLAELATVGVAASIGNAVFHATGTRQRTLPLRPDRLVNLA